MIAEDTILLEILERIAVVYFDGHLTIFRFTKDWRVGFGTYLEEDINRMLSGRTFAEAARAAILQYPSHELFSLPRRERLRA